MKKINVLLFFIFSSISFLFSQPSTFHSTYNDYTGDWTDPISWENADGNLTNNDSVHIYGFISRNSGITLNNGIIMRVYDTLIVHGDLWVENNGYLNIESGGFLIVYGNVTADNNVVVDLNSYLVTFGDFTQNNNSEVDAPEDDTLLYVTGDATCGGGGTICLDDSLIGDEDAIYENPDLIDLILGTSSMIIPRIPSFCTGGSVELSIRKDGDPGTYQWYLDGSPIPGANSPSYTATSVGSYDVSYDIEGITKDPDPVTVTEYNIPVIDIASNSPVCFGDTIQLNETGGEATNWYWTGPDSFSSTDTNPVIPDVTEAEKGTYSLTVSNGSCENNETIDIIVLSVFTVGNITGESSGTQCYNYDPAAMSVSPGGGSGSYSYQWQSSTDNGVSWNNITGATLASYNPSSIAQTTWYRVMADATGSPDCGGPTVSDNQIEITILGDFTAGNITGESSGTQCYNYDPAAMTVSPGGGSGNYSYQWQSSTDNGVSWNNITGATLASYNPSSIAQTTWYRVMADATGSPDCGGLTVSDNQIEISISPIVEPPVFVMGTSSTRCQDAGTITYSSTAVNSSEIIYSLDVSSLAAGNIINSGTGQVSYVSGWNGTSVITATALGCGGPITNDHTVTVIASPAIPTGDTVQSFCLTSNPTVNDLTADGISIQWYDDETGGSPLSPALELLDEDIYHAAQVIGGCESANRLSVLTKVYSGVPEAAGFITGEQGVCLGESILNYSVQEINGAKNYIWAYSGSGTSIVNNGNEISIDFASDAESGIPSVRGENLCGLGEESTLPVTIHLTPEIDPVDDKTECFSYELPEITGTNLSANCAYYSESGGKGDKYLPGQIIESDISLYVYDGNSNCNTEDNFNINILSVPVDLGSDIMICDGELHTFSLSGYSSYKWNGTEGDYEYTVSEEGEVSVEVLDEYDCQSTDVVNVSLLSSPELYLGNDTAICSEEGYQIEPGDYLVYEWSTGENTNSIIVMPGEQTISLRVENSNGCEASDEIVILRCQEKVLDDITNVFTPNDDNVHDTWIINGLEQFQEARIEVFDRWGRRVFLLEGDYSESTAWNGTFNGKGLPMDNYFYVIDLYGDRSEILEGNVTLIK